MSNSVFRNIKTIAVEAGNNNNLGKPDIINFTGDVTSEVVNGKLKLTVNTGGGGSSSSDPSILTLKSYYNLPNLTPVGINKDGNVVPIKSTELEINQLVGVIVNSPDNYSQVSKVAGNLTGVFSNTVQDFVIKVYNG
jgi:hypothetical protein